MPSQWGWRPLRWSWRKWRPEGKEVGKMANKLKSKGGTEKHDKEESQNEGNGGDYNAGWRVRPQQNRKQTEQVHDDVSHCGRGDEHRGGSAAPGGGGRGDWIDLFSEDRLAGPSTIKMGNRSRSLHWLPGWRNKSRERVLHRKLKNVSPSRARVKIPGRMRLMSLAMMVSLFTVLLLLAMWGGLKAPVSMAIRTTLNRKVEDQTDRAEERHKLTEWIKDQPVEAKKEARSGLSSRHPRRWSEASEAAKEYDDWRVENWGTSRVKILQRGVSYSQNR